MEAVHKTDTRSWITSKINVRQFRDDWQKTICTFQVSTKKEFKMSPEEYADLEEECGLAAMKCPAQDYIEISEEFNIPEDVTLQTLNLQKADIEKRKKDPKYEAFVYCNSKNYNYPPHNNVGDELSNPYDADGYVKVDEPDVVLWVQVFRPEKRSATYYKYNQARLPNFTIDQEFIVLGCQYLTELRDKIDCVSDRAIPGDYSDYPELPPETTCKDLYKSGFFYIDGTFYNDMRHADCRDYSEPIITWANSSNRSIGPFRKGLMQKTQFIDLDIQLGYPYVYVHQGDCEHLIVFSDLQYYTHHHCSNRLQYPLHVSPKPKRRVLCMICRIHTAEWIVFDNKRLPENPFYFCKICFFSFNYDENNQKIGSFRAYHHIDRSNIL